MPPKSEKLHRWSSPHLLTLVAGMLSGVVALSIPLVSFFFQWPGTGTNLTQISVSRLEKIESQTTAIGNELTNLKGRIEALSNVPNEAKIAVQIKAIDSTLTDLKISHAKLEEVILNNPAKAIEIPLLRKDLDNLKDAQQQNLLALKQGVDQVYDLNKWLLGAMAVSILTLAISNLLKGREKDKPQAG